ncbi:Uncharacterised protein [Mycobacteroides abscessus subsp. abscessus]|nr:Uncharacterised protein [Mycobacteroides abscessus subsp. abscessus]
MVCSPSMRAVKVAKETAIIRGRMIEYWPVSSNNVTTAVIGPPVAPPSSAPMPIKA